MKKGQVSILHSHVVHGSETNNSDRFRRNLLGGYLLDGATFKQGGHMKRELIDIYSMSKKTW